jgi:hypothetical protein
MFPTLARVLGLSPQTDKKFFANSINRRVFEKLRDWRRVQDKNDLEAFS